jgi:uncharacterized protein with FMN-binding domain
MVIGAVGAAIVVAAGWQLGVALDPGAATPTATAPLTPGASGLAAASPSAGAGAGAAVSGTFAGSSVSTRYGTVQVRIVVVSGKITDVVPVHLTDQGGRSVQLSNQAAPILRSEVIKAQSAKVNGVSGATYTSVAYLASVQAAIDKAGI